MKFQLFVINNNSSKFRYLALPFTSSVTVGKLLDFSEPQFSQL